MSEALFPILGPLVVFAVALPLSALVAKGLLVVLSIRDRDAVHANHGLRYAILVSATVLPLVWFVSAAIVQAGSAARVCATGHSPGASCWEAVYFALALGAICAVVGFRRARHRVGAASGSDLARGVARRIEGIVARQPALASLGSRLVVSDSACEPICTTGILAPRVVVQTRFAASLDDSALAGALLHELEHVHARDPLRYFVASWALALNPIGALLLRGEHARWVLGREAHCDREAVLSGAKPAALAHALVAAARVPHGTAVPCLGGRLAAVKFRVGLLLAYADRAPTRCCHDGPALRLALLVALLMFALPYAGGTDALDAVHTVAEIALHLTPS